MEETGLPDDSDTDKELQKQNVSIDFMIANIVRYDKSVTVPAE